MAIYPWAALPASENQMMETVRAQDVELFRRLLEAYAHEPVEVSLEQDAYRFGSMARIFFRNTGYYVMVDINCARYGEIAYDQLAQVTVKKMKAESAHRQNSLVSRAYSSMANFEPDWGGTKGTASPPKTKKSKEQEIIAMMQENNIPVKMPVGSYDNPLRVELQKKVDIWLKEKK